MMMPLWDFLDILLAVQRLLWNTLGRLLFLEKSPIMEIKGERGEQMFLGGLDELDRKIVQSLIQNARVSYSEIGQQIGISRVAVKMRIQSLEQRGVIEEYTTIINPQKISGAVSCYFEIETIPETLSEVTDILRGNDTITQIYRVTGKNKLHIHAVAASGEEMEKLIQEIIDPLPGVTSSSCNMILSRIKDVKGLRL